MDISSEALASLSRLSKLTSFSISSIADNGLDLRSIAKLTNLRSLSFADNVNQTLRRAKSIFRPDDGVSDPCIALSSLRNLTKLHVPSVALLGRAGSLVVGLPNLKWLDCCMLAVGPDCEASSSTIEHLEVTQFPVRYPHAQPEPIAPGLSVAVPGSLKSITLDMTGLAPGNALHHMAALASGISCITIYGADISSTPQEFASALRALTNLQHLKLCNSSMDSTMFNALGACRALKSLHIQLFMNLDDAGTATLLQCSELREATFALCPRLTRATPAVLGRMPSMRKISMLQCDKVEKADMCWVQQCVSRAAVEMQIGQAPANNSGRLEAMSSLTA